MMAARYTYTLIQRADTLDLPNAWRHCVHVMLYTPVPKNTLLFNSERYPIPFTIMMQMRFDGRLGFPGGFVDDTDKSLEDALHRELEEEMGNLPKSLNFKQSDHLFSHLLEEKKYCLHFFAKELTFEDYLMIEKRNPNQPYEGFEVLGVMRVPLFIMSDNRGGFPAFLKNNFIGNSKDQLISGIRERKLLSEEILEKYLHYNRLTDKLSDSNESGTIL